MEISFIVKAYWLDCVFLNPDISKPGKVIIGSLILMNNLVINPDILCSRIKYTVKIFYSVAQTQAIQNNVAINAWKKQNTKLASSMPVTFVSLLIFFNHIPSFFFPLSVLISPSTPPKPNVSIPLPPAIVPLKADLLAVSVRQRNAGNVLP